MSDEVKNFAKAIGATRPQRGDKNYKTSQLIFRRSNYYKHSQGFMIIKISRIEKPFWGVGKFYIDFLNDLKISFFLVLLDSEKSGYVFNEKEVNRFIDRKEWRLASDDNYKISVPLPDRYYFKNKEMFLRTIGTNHK